MAPAVVAALIQALITIGPSAIQAIEALVKASKGEPLSQEEHAAGQRLAVALQAKKPA
jgi:hypothetical protein